MERTTDGKFASGNAGGPGRPPRPVERDYLASLGDSVPLESWKKIVATAVDRAIEGDSKARDWLSRYLLGNQASDKPMLDLARRELQGLSSQQEIEKHAECDKSFSDFSSMLLEATADFR